VIGREIRPLAQGRLPKVADRGIAAAPPQTPRRPAGHADSAAPVWQVDQQCQEMKKPGTSPGM